MFYYFSFLFCSHSFLRPVDFTVLNSETGNCNGSLAGHLSYTRFIFLRAKMKQEKEDRVKEIVKGHIHKKTLNLSRNMEGNGMKKITCFVLVRPRKERKTTQSHSQSHFLKKLVISNILNFLSWANWPWLRSLTVASLQKKLYGK
jgi:hypothetical protein